MAAALCAGCHSPQYRLATAANIYYDLLRARTENCSGAPDPSCLPCRQALEAADRDLVAAGEALKRGGSVKPQEERVRASIKAAQIRCKWAKDYDRMMAALRMSPACQP